MKITQEQREQLVNLNDSRVNEILGVNKLEKGKWYKGIDEYSEWLLLYQGGKNTYVFWDGTWGVNWNFSEYGDIQENSIEATNEEVENALIAEAKRRGLTHNSLIKDCNGVYFNKGYGSYVFKNNKLHYNGSIIFKDGKWAEVIEQKPSKQEIINQINELLNLL